MNDSSTQKKSGTDWKRLQEIRDDEIDFSDIPPVNKAVFKKMAVRIPDKSSAISIRLDQHVIAWFKEQGPGYQARISDVLKSYVEAQS